MSDKIPPLLTANAAWIVTLISTNIFTQVLALLSTLIAMIIFAAEVSADE